MKLTKRQLKRIIREASDLEQLRQLFKDDGARAVQTATQDQNIANSAHVIAMRDAVELVQDLLDKIQNPGPDGTSQRKWVRHAKQRMTGLATAAGLNLYPGIMKGEDANYPLQGTWPWFYIVTAVAENILPFTATDGHTACVDCFGQGNIDGINAVRANANIQTTYQSALR